MKNELDEVQQALINLLKLADSQGSDTVAMVNALVSSGQIEAEIAALIVDRMAFIFQGIGLVAHALEVPHEVLEQAIEADRPVIH